MIVLRTTEVTAAARDVALLLEGVSQGGEGCLSHFLHPIPSHRPQSASPRLPSDPRRLDSGPGTHSQRDLRQVISLPEPQVMDGNAGGTSLENQEEAVGSDPAEPAPSKPQGCRWL